MASFGQGINPSLGRIDYSAYQQGANQGSAAIGQGLESLGHAAGAALKSYYDKKEASDLFKAGTERISTIFKESPELAGQFGLKDPGDTKAIGATLLNLAGGDKRKAGQLAAQIGQQVSQQKAQSKSLSSLIQNGDITTALKAGAPPEAVKQYIDMMKANSDMANTNAQTGLYNAQARVAGQPKEVNPSDRDNYFAALVQDAEAKTPGASKDPAVVAALKTKAYAPSQQNITVNQGDDILNQAFKDLSGRASTDISPALAAVPAIDAMQELLSKTDENGIITGTFAPAELATKAALNRAGLSNFKDVASTQQYLGTSGRLVATIIKDFGAGTGLSDADREYAKKIAAGDITMSKEALTKLVKMAKSAVQNKVKMYNSDVSKMFSGDTPQDMMGRRLMVPESYIGGASEPTVFEKADAILGR